MTKLTREEKEVLSPEQRALIEVVEKEEEYERKARAGEYSLLKTMNVFFFGHPSPPIGLQLGYYGGYLVALLLVFVIVPLIIF